MSLAGLLACAHYPVLFAGGVLTDYDLFAYFYPYWEHRAAALRDGTLPLWNPYLFTGVPLLANPQAGVFYPLNWPLAWLPAPKAVAVSYTFHLWLAGAGLFWLLRWAKCSPLAAGVAALTLSLGGVFAAQAGHINQVQAASWLPLLVLAMMKGSVGWALAGACFYGLAFLAGHPQQVFISSGALALVALWQACAAGPRMLWRRARTLLGPEREATHSSPAALDAGRSQAAVRWHPLPEWVLASLLPFGRLALIVSGGLALSGAQLLPSLELSSFSVRSGGLGYTAASSFSLPPHEVLRSFLPTYGDQTTSEYIAYAGVTGLLLGYLALWKGRPGWLVALFALTAAAGLFLALGRYNPIYRLLYEHLPGFDLFRAPARWLLLWSLGLSGLAGVGAGVLLRASGPGVDRRRATQSAPMLGLAHHPSSPAARLRGAVAAARLLSASPRTLVTLLLAAGAAVSVLVTLRAGGPLVVPHAPAPLAWAAAGGLVLLAFVAGRFSSRAGAAILLSTLAGELLFARSPLPVANPAPPPSYSEIRPALAHLLQDEELHRTLSIADPAYQPGDLEVLRASLPELTSLQLKDMVTAFKYRETVTPNLGLLLGTPTLDGYDGGVLPLKQFAAFKAALLATAGVPEPADPLQAEGEGIVLIRDRAATIPDLTLLGALNVKYLIADRIWDVWVDGVYHDLGAPVRLDAGGRMSLDTTGWPDATAVSVISYLEGSETVPQGMPVARVLVDQGSEGLTSWDLRAGIETAESNQIALAQASHGPAWRAGTRRWNPSGAVYAARIELTGRGPIRSVHIAALLPSSSITIAGFAAVDRQTGLTHSPPVNGALVRVLTGDLKVYENRSLRPRVSIARRPAVIAEPAAQLRAFVSSPVDTVVLAQPVDLPPDAHPLPGRDEIRAVDYADDRITVDARLVESGLLVISDTFYPGWRATVDGVPAGVVQANYMFRAVPVPGGDHQVVLWYEPDSLRAGIGLSVAALVVMAAIAALVRRAAGPGGAHAR